MHLTSLWPPAQFLGLTIVKSELYLPKPPMPSNDKAACTFLDVTHAHSFSDVSLRMGSIKLALFLHQVISLVGHHHRLPLQLSNPIL